MLKKATLILAVSEWFEGWLRKRYPEFEGKIGHLTNGVDWEALRNNKKAAVTHKNSVISIGGGMPRKRIFRVCEAIELLRERTGEDIRLTLIGAEGADSDKIAAYPFVTNLGMVESKEVSALLGEHDIYIQNSEN